MSDRPKIQSNLVERPRQNTWWHGLDVIAPVPHYSTPSINGHLIAVVMDHLFYCLNNIYHYAVAWEFDLNIKIGMISPLQWHGSDKLGLTVLLQDGRYQGIMIDLENNHISRYTLMKGKEYHPLYIFEDRYPLKPISTSGLFHN